MSTKGSWSRVDDNKRFQSNHDDIFKKKKEIEADMRLLIEWAKAYEEGEPIESDSVYDAQVRKLIRDEKEFPRDWEGAERNYPEFKDGSWKYTGSFYHGETK